MTTRITNKELAKQFSDMQEILRRMTEKKPSKIRQLWNFCKPYIIPFVFGMLFGHFVSMPFAFSPQPTIEHKTTLEQQAAQGGAAIPFPSGNPSPTLSTPPPENSTALGDRRETAETQSTASSLTKISEPPSLPNPQADNGQTNSQKSFRRTLLRTH
jgi:hypothetical protein